MAIDFRPTTEVKPKTAGASKIDFRPGSVAAPAPSVSEPKKTPGLLGSIYKSIAEPVVNLIARPGQAVQAVKEKVTGEDGGYLEGEVPIGFGMTATVTDPRRVKEQYGGGVSGGVRAVAADVGRAAETVALGLGPVAGGAAYMGGERLKEGAEFGDSALDTAKGVAGKALLGAGVGKAGDLAFRAFGKVLKVSGDKLLQPFKSSFKPEVAAAAARQGIKAPLSAQTDSKFVQALEANAAGGSFGARVEKTINEARKKIFDITEGMKRKVDADDLIDTRKTAEVAGNAMKDSFTKATEVFNKAKNEVYEGIEARIGKNPAILTNTKKALAEIIEQKKSSMEPGSRALAKYYEKFLQNVSKADKSVFSAVKRSRTDIGAKLKNRMDPITTGDGATLKRLYAALSDDLDLTASQFDPAAGEALEAANKFYKEGITKLNSTMGSTIFRSKSPERLVEKIIAPKQISEVRELKALVGEQAFGDVRQAFTNGFFEKSMAPMTGKISAVKLHQNIVKYGDDVLKEVLGDDGFRAIKELQKNTVINDILEKAISNGRVLPTQLARNMNKYGDDVLKELLGPDDFQKLVDVRTLSDAMAKGSRLYGGSQTAEKMDLSLKGLMLLTGKIPTLIGKLASEFGLSKAISTDMGRKYLTTGFGTIKPLSAAGGLVSRVPGAIKDLPRKPIPGTTQKTAPVVERVLRYSESEGPAAVKKAVVRGGRYVKDKIIK